MARVLLVDDDGAVLAALAELVRAQGHEAIPVSSGAEALPRLDGADVVVTDLAMPGMDGLELLRAIRERDEALPVVLLTAHGSERVAVRAMKAGAYEYVSKPFDVDEMAVVIDRAAEARALRAQSRRLRAEQAIGRRIIGGSAPMRRLLEAVGRVAPKDVTVLVRGETGVGKELVGALLHAESPRAAGPLVRFNCAAIPPELAEAELFGHVRGAFTGAIQGRSGFFAQAHGGTLVLDEVGELPAGVQAKLLRALQDGEIQPVGAGRLEKVDVRIVACTNRDLEAEARAGRFRADLYYRLAVVELVVPPLRERREDVPELARELLRRCAERFGVEDARLAPALVDRLAASDWPGNVRQLENTIARLVALSTGGEIGPDALDPTPGLAPPAPPPGAPPAVDAGVEGDSPGEPDRPLTLREQLDAVERGIIARAMTAAGGNQSEAARRLGVSRGTLIDRLKRFGLAPDYGGARR